jgi:hypothetical protein
MKAYLDNNIVSAIAKDDEPAESDPLDRLLKAEDEGKIDLVTSELTLAEIKRYQDTRIRAVIERIFRLLEKVEIVRWDKLVGMHSYGDERTWITTPFIENHPEYGALLALGLDVIDAPRRWQAGVRYLPYVRWWYSPTRRRHQKHLSVADGAEAFAVGCEPRMVKSRLRSCGVR